MRGITEISVHRRPRLRSNKVAARNQMEKLYCVSTNGKTQMFRHEKAADARQ